ncbi:tetratricopeptide repeat protein [Comamonas jiangduensis]|uniref:Tetratricopeptide repeat protein n=1 Tax=Comamonas jiangduensis TaxID=1194168 RepID=A0ABV4I9V0_9BURK
MDPNAEALQPSPADEAAALDAELFYDLLVGEMAASQGDATNAIALLMDAARQSQSQQLYQRAAEIALQSRSGQQAFIVANEWQTNFPQSRDANRYLLQILLRLNRISESQEPLSREVAWTNNAAKPATYLAVAQLYSRATDKALAAAVVEQALQPDLQNPDLAPAAWATIGHMRINANQKDLALQALAHAYAQGPRNGATALLALELMETGMPSAEAMAQDYMRDKPAPTIQMAYARVLMGQNRWDDAQNQLTLLLKANPDMVDAWMAQANIYAQNGKWRKAQQAMQRVENIAQDISNEAQRSYVLSQAYLLGGRIALQAKDYALALQWLDKIPDSEALLNVQSLKAQALAKQGKLAQGRALIRATPARNDAEAMQKRQAEVALLRENNAPQEAYLLQLTLHEQLPNDPDIAYETAILAERAGKVDAMENILRDLIAKHPTHHHGLNALGYSYADRGIRLPEAKSLIESALQLAPDDPFITDSLAWVEFRMGNSSKALELLEKAYAQREDVEIAAHLGEVLWSMGNKERARAVWRQALERDADNETLRATLNRLQVRP